MGSNFIFLLRKNQKECSKKAYFFIDNYFISAIICSIYIKKCSRIYIYIYTYYMSIGKGLWIVARHVLSVLVNNHMGVLSRVSGLFSRRGYSIESLSSGTTENSKVARMTIVVECEDNEFRQIKNQLAKLMDVVKISECFDDSSVKRELALIKIDCQNEKRSQIIEIANIFRAHVVDVTNSTMILEVTGDRSKVSAIISMLDEFGIKEVIRTGATAIARGDSELKNLD